MKRNETAQAGNTDIRLARMQPETFDAERPEKTVPGT
jgi:hypothetical protein